MREACERVLRDTPREALQYAASEGYGPLREWVAAQLAAQGLKVRGRAGADHHRLAAGAGPGRQGADRRRQPRRGRIAHLPGRAAGLRAVRAGLRRGRLRRRRARCRRPLAAAAGARFLYLLPNFQNPSGRCMGARATRCEVAQAAARAGLPLVEDNPYGDLWFDAPPPPPLAAAGGRRRDLPRLLLQGAGAGAAPGLRGGAAGAVPEAAAGQAGGRPAHARLQPARGARGHPQRLPRHARAARSARATRRSATRCARRSTRTCRPAAASTCRPAACSSGSSCPHGAGRGGAAAEGGGRRHGLRARRALLLPCAARATRCA